MKAITPAHDSRCLRELVDTSQRLLDALARIEVEGWDGGTGRAVLEYAREKVVRPAVHSVGFSGANAEFAEATGWGAAWEALRAPALRGASSPWGVVSAAVRHAVLGERMAEKYGTGARSAWRIHSFRLAEPGATRDIPGEWNAVADRRALAQPVSLTALLEEGFDWAEPGAIGMEWGGRMEAIVNLLVGHGWQPAVVRAAIAHVSEHARPNPAGRPRARGWKEMAIGLGIPTWQARRVTVLLLGAPRWPGLVERLATGGDTALVGPAIEAAVRSTCEEQMRPPATAALAIESRPLRAAV